MKHLAKVVLDIGKYSFSNRVISEWYQLSEEVVEEIRSSSVRPSLSTKVKFQLASFFLVVIQIFV